jgi:hypothetical protein
MYICKIWCHPVPDLGLVLMYSYMHTYTAILAQTKHRMWDLLAGNPKPALTLFRKSTARINLYIYLRTVILQKILTK